MSDKPTRDAMIKCYVEAGWNKHVASDFIMTLYKKHPEWFAPDPDPVEEFIKDACLGCRLLGDCTDDAGGVIDTCRARRDALRAYVAELRWKAGEK